MTTRYSFVSALRLLRRQPPSALYRRSFSASRRLKDDDAEGKFASPKEGDYDYRKPCLAKDRRNCMFPCISYQPCRYQMTWSDLSPCSYPAPDALRAERSHGNHILPFSRTISRRTTCRYPRLGNRACRAAQASVRRRRAQHRPTA